MSEWPNQSRGRSQQAKRTCAAIPYTRRLRFEQLEDRRLMANVTVSNTNDVVNGTTTSIASLIATPGGDGISLREAILAANADLAADTIGFSVNGTIQLTNALHVGEIVISNNLTINGPGASLLTIRGFAGTAAAGDGARIFNVDDSNVAIFKDVLISGLTLTAADSGTSGGAIRVATENLTIPACTISGNSAQGSGGGIYGNATIINSTISGNTATGSGGGIANDSGNLTITNSTISGNTAQVNGGGVAAIYSDAVVRQSTITDNRANSDGNFTGIGGGVFVTVLGSNVSMDHTVVAGNLRGFPTVDARNDVSGPLTARYSLIGDNTGATLTDNGGNQIGTGASPIAPLLGPLADNGGVTLTHALLAGSPAIDAGDPAAVAGVGSVPQFDQRGTGFPRVVNGRIDIGAFELALPGDYNRNGTVDSGDYVLWRKTLGTTGISAYLGADGDGDTTIDQDDYSLWRAHFGQAVPPPGSGAGEAPSVQIQELRADAPAVSNIAAGYTGESVVQIPMETISAPAETDATAARSASFAALESRSPGHESSSRSRRTIHRYHVAESGGDDLLLLAIGRVGRFSPQGIAEVDERRRDDVHADDPESQSLIDESPRMALAEWRWVCRNTGVVRR